MRCNFLGRDEELAWLRRQFDECAVDGRHSSPRMAFVVAESGIGKSRLVQELYLDLTRDPQWDPPNIDYWPDAFEARGEELRVIPDMTGHQAKGPPRFIWLGARWHPSEERNAHATRSILPELRAAMMVHAEIVRAHQSIWQEGARRIASAVRQDAAGEAMGQAADYVAAAALVPCGGLIAKLAIGGLRLARDRYRGPVGFEEALRKQTASDADELLECFRLLLGTQTRVPVVLWLDDAHWIDATSLGFLRRLWQDANKKQWPLFVVLTHWEREWRELACSADSSSLRDFCGNEGVAELQLSAATNTTLGKCVRTYLPGLTDSQVALMVEKAAGNFLQMTENVGQLIAEPMNFVDERLDNALTEEAVEDIQHFESDREKRVKQRFQRFEADVKKVLGWSSQLGKRFLSDVVQSFAKERLGRDDISDIIRRCVDPYVVLDSPSPLTKEFRDKVFHNVADAFRHRYLTNDHEHLSAVLRSHLVAWLSESIDCDGNMASAETSLEAAKGLAALSTEERRDLLGCALVELQLPPSPDWSNPEQRAAFWAICLAIELDSRESLWARVRSHLALLGAVVWQQVPLRICGARMREGLAAVASSCGCLQIALQIAANLCIEEKRTASEKPGSASATAYSDALQLMGDIERDLGFLDASLGHHKEALAIRKEVLSAEATADNRRCVVESLNRIGDVEAALGRTDEALIAFEAMLALTKEIQSDDASLLASADLSVALNRIADIKRCQGRDDEALVQYEEVLAIRRALASQLKTPWVLESVSNSLERISDIKVAQGRFEEALEHSQEALDIRRDLLAEEELPSQLRAVGSSLNRIGDIEQKRGRLEEALTCYEAMLQIHRQLLSEEETPQRLRDMCVAVSRVADIELEYGHESNALKQYKDALDVALRLLDTGEPFDALHLVVWFGSRVVVLLTAISPQAALDVAKAEIPFAEQLECSSADNHDHLTTCGMFWEACARASEAAGNASAAADAAARVASLLGRLQELE